MAILTDGQMLEELKKGTIEISPFNPEKIGSNSYDLHLSKNLLVYDLHELDSKKDNPATELIIPPEGILIQPGKLYLGVTQEFTKTDYFVPIIDGKSSIGRLGINIHA